METVADFIFLGSKITADGDCSREIKRRFLLWRKVMTNLDSILKSRDITLPTKVRLVKAMVFHSHVWVWELDYKESWAPKNWCFWTVVLEKGTTEDEMVGWHHWLDGHGFGWTPGVGVGQGGLACCGLWGRRTQLSDWTVELSVIFQVIICDIISYHRKSKRSEYDKRRLINRVEMFSGLEHCSVNCSWG